MTMDAKMFLIIVIGIVCRLVRTSDDEHRLIRYLFSEQGYNPLVRPIQHLNQTVVVSFGLLLVQLIHVFEKEQVMKTNTWLHLKWFDRQLRWNPARYGGIDKINVPFTNVWTPDVVLFNNADGNYEVTFKSKVVLMHTGEVHWVPPAIYKSSCRIDVKYFPFDTQQCEMRFASWTYNAREVTFSHYAEDYNIKTELTKLLPQQSYSASKDELYKDDYLESGTWDVLSIPSKFVHYRSNASSLSPDRIEVVFLIKMKRKTLYYTVNLIVPTGLMTILICIVFCLPTAAGEKMTLCMSILLALNLFQLLVTKILPPTSADVPLIAKYLLFTFTLNILVIVNTVVITNFYFRTPMTHSMPAWLRRLFLFVLPKILWMDAPSLRENALVYDDRGQSLIIENPAHINQMKSTLPSSPMIAHFQDHRSNSHDSYVSYIHDKHRTSTILLKPISHSKDSHHRRARREQQTFILVNGKTRLIPIHSKQHRQRMQLELMRQEINQALGNIRYIARHCAHEAVIESVRNEWKFIATVVDRLQFVTFSTVTILGSLALLFQVPNMFQMPGNDLQKLVRFANPNLTIDELIPSLRN